MDISEQRGVHQLYSMYASFISETWQLQTPVMTTVAIPEQHTCTQTVTAEHLNDLAQQWSVKQKVVLACLHDTAANIKNVGECDSWTDINFAAE